jgi:hypothetical protein
MLAQRYSYVLPESRLLEVLRGHAPLVEIGAGTGYWAYKLRLTGVDIIAYDRSPLGGAAINRYHGAMAAWAEVLEGDQRSLTAHADRALFVCWPPLFSTLGDCLSFYAGDVVICISDGGCRTARLSGIEDQFEQVANYPAHALEPAAGHPAMLTVWRRWSGASAAGKSV